MTTSNRFHGLEIVTEQCKVLKKEPEMIIPVRNLKQYGRQINLFKPNKISDFLR